MTDFGTLESLFEILLNLLDPSIFFKFNFQILTPKNHEYHFTRELFCKILEVIPLTIDRKRKYVFIDRQKSLGFILKCISQVECLTWTACGKTEDCHDVTRVCR